MTPAAFRRQIADLSRQLADRALDATLDTWLNHEHGAASATIKDATTLTIKSPPELIFLRSNVGPRARTIVSGNCERNWVLFPLGQSALFRRLMDNAGSVHRCCHRQRAMLLCASN